MSPIHLHQQHFTDRRFKVFEKMGAQSACLIPSANKHLRNGDAEYPFRQNSYLYYLTGWPEDQALMVMLNKDGQNRLVLFCEESDPHQTRWLGPRVGLEEAKKGYGATESYLFEDIETVLPELLSGLDKIYYPLGQCQHFDKLIHTSLEAIGRMKRKGWVAPKHHIELSSLLDEFRLIKMGDEIGRMRKAASISAHAHRRAMLACKVGMFEYQLEAEYRHEFLNHGAHDVAYMPIVASGSNACILHYTQNHRKIQEGELVLVDAGCEYHGYASDITRTFPAGKQFTAPQQEIYELVLNSQKEALKQAKQGIPWSAMQEAVVKVLTQGLIDLKILKGDCQTLIEEQAYLPFYMHQSGHWLGLDVHDVGEYKIDQKWRLLEPGMMLTVEPGLYFPLEDLSVPEKYRGIGVRIEDDVLITDNAPDVLSKEAPKEVSELEALLAGKT